MQLDKLLGNTLQHHKTNTNARKYKDQYLKPKRKYHRTSSAKERLNQKSTQVKQLTWIPRTHTGPDKPFHLRAKGGKKPFRRHFGKERNDRLILHSNLLGHQITNSGKMNSRGKSQDQPLAMTADRQPTSLSVTKKPHFPDFARTGITPITYYQFLHKHSLFCMLLSTAQKTE